MGPDNRTCYSPTFGCLSHIEFTVFSLVTRLCDWGETADSGAKVCAQLFGDDACERVYCQQTDLRAGLAILLQNSEYGLLYIRLPWWSNQVKWDFMASDTTVVLFGNVNYTCKQDGACMAIISLIEILIFVTYGNRLGLVRSLFLQAVERLKATECQY